MRKLTGKKVLIFGGLGLIGSNVARYYIQNGAVVTIADNRHPEYGANDYNLEDIKDRFELVIGDIRDKEFVESLVEDKEYIYNFAAQVNHNKSIEDPIFDNEINCIGHINVLMACKNCNRGAVIAYPGSRLQYGKTISLPVHESHPREPLSVYAIHKNTAEQYYQAFFKHYGIRSVCFRIANPYGPRSQMKHSGYSIVNWFIRQAMDNEPLTIYGDGSQLRDYIFIDDAVHGMITAMHTADCHGQVYNLGSGKGTKFVDMAEAVIKTVGSGKLIKVAWPQDYDHFETGDFVSDITALRTATGWDPKHDIENGIQKTLEYYKIHKDKYW